MQLAGVGRLRAGVIVKTAGQAVHDGTSPPPIRLLGGVCLAIIGFDVAVLGLSEPVVVTTEQRVEPSKVFETNLRILNRRLRQVDPLREVLLLSWRTSVRLQKLFDKGVQSDEQCRGVRVVRILDLELGRDLGSCLGAENLLAANPAILVNQAEPALDDLQSQVDVPICNRKEMESLIPEEPAREERPRGTLLKSSYGPSITSCRRARASAVSSQKPSFSSSYSEA